MNAASVAKLKFILPTLRTMSEKALASELDKLSGGMDIIEFYKNLNQAMDFKKRNILFIGAPGSGKGTYSRIISPLLLIPTFGSGDYMKKEISGKTAFGDKVKPFLDKGKLAPDDIVLPEVLSILSQPIYKPGVILDGFPRNLSQAKAIENILPIDLVVHFHLPRDVLIEKLIGRRVCPHCSRTYNIASITNDGYHLPPLLPQKENECDQCHELLVQRNDDKQDVIETRLSIYEEQTSPLLKYFGSEGKNILKRFDVKKGVADVPDILKTMTIHYITSC